MTSSISHSKDASRRIPRSLVLVVITAIAAWCLSAAYTLFFNPEVALFKHAVTVKQAWSKRLDAEFTNKVVIIGGSSSTFSVDAGEALKTGHVPIANLALGAGMGVKVLTRFGLPELRRGDTLLLMFEPGLLQGDLEPTQLGTQICIAVGHANFAHPSNDLLPERRLPLQNYFAALRPGGYHFFTLLGKVIRGQPLYRYTTADFDESGHQQTAAKAPLVTPGGTGQISPDARAWLSKLKAHCKSLGAEIAYALPWAYCPTAETEAFKRHNASFLKQMMELVPVLREPGLGAYSVEEHFADTAFHLNKQGAAIRTAELTRAITARSFWNSSDLEAFLPPLQ